MLWSGLHALFTLNYVNIAQTTQFLVSRTDTGVIIEQINLNSSVTVTPFQ